MSYTPLEIGIFCDWQVDWRFGVVVLAVLSACYKEVKRKTCTADASSCSKRRKKDFVRTDSIYLETIKFLSGKQRCETSSATRRDSFMTIFGIGGCMALLLLGFGIKDSISAISEKQYGGDHYL